jgi:CheY-like chemotaxis protein
LVVEDEPELRASLRSLLEADGYQVLTADNGREALDVLRADTTRPDLVLVDLHMPVMNGWQLVDEIREQTAFDELPVIVHSSSDDKLPPTRVAAALRKPVDPVALLALIRSYCR